MTYTVTQEIKRRAKALGVEVRPSRNPKKKLDVYDKDDNSFIASIGQAGANDYHLWLKEKGQAYANERRRLYHIRHKGEAPRIKNGKPTASHLAKVLLW